MKKNYFLLAGIALFTLLPLVSCDTGVSGGNNATTASESDDTLLHASFATAPDGLSSETATSVTDLEVPCAVNTTRGSLTVTGSCKIGSGLPGYYEDDATENYINGTLTFTLPAMTGPFTIKVYTTNTGDTTEDYSRYAVVTDSDCTILAAGDANPRGDTSGLSMSTLTYSYEGTSTVTLYITGSKDVSTTGEVVDSNIGLKYFDIYVTQD